LNWLKPGDLPRLNEIGIDRSVFAFTALISFFTGLVFGIVPAMTASKPDLQKMLKEGAIAGARSRHMLRNALVVSEVAVAVLLLAGAGLLLNSFLRLQRVNTGVDVDRVLTSAVVLPSRKYSVPAQQLAFYQELLSRIEALPGVESASISTAMPLGGGAGNDPFSIEGRELDPNRPNFAGWQRVTPSYFRTLGIPIIRGRGFDDHDNAEGPRVAIINEAMARKYWPNEDAIGKRITLGRPRPGNPFATIVGVAKDIPRRA